jgi:hypothetical protein
MEVRNDNHPKNKKLDVYEAFNYALRMSKEEGLSAHFSSLGFDMGDIG